MAGDKIQITELPAISSIDGDELGILRDTTGDVKFTVDELTTYVLDQLTATDTLDLVKAANPEVNGLNANLLQGLAASFFQNASNLASGTVPDARLPGWLPSPSWTSGGAYPNAGSFKDYIRIPSFLLSGQSYMIQFGWTNFVPNNTTVNVTFRTPFVSGWGGENTPWVGVFPHCRSNEYPSELGADDSVELDMRVRGQPSLAGFTCASIRTQGTGTDYVRGVWIAIGKY